MLKESLNIIYPVETEQQIEKSEDILLRKIENYKNDTNKLKIDYEDFNEIFKSLSLELLMECWIRSTNDLINFIGYEFEKSTENNIKNNEYTSNNKSRNLENNTWNVISIKKWLNKYEIEKELNWYKILKQDIKTTVCWYYNLFSTLEWTHLQNGSDIPNISDIPWFSKKRWLSPKAFVKLFNEFSPNWYTIDLIHPDDDKIIEIIHSQINLQLPIPIIYVPVWWKVHSPHYATITWIWYDKKWNEIYKLIDSMENVIPRNYLTKKELIETIKFNNLKSNNLILDIWYKLFNKLTKMVAWWENNIFIINPPNKWYVDLSFVA